MACSSAFMNSHNISVCALGVLCGRSTSAKLKIRYSCCLFITTIRPNYFKMSCFLQKTSRSSHCSPAYFSLPREAHPTDRPTCRPTGRPNDRPTCLPTSPRGPPILFIHPSSHLLAGRAPFSRGAAGRGQAQQPITALPRPVELIKHGPAGGPDQTPPTDTPCRHREAS